MNKRILSKLFIFLIAAVPTVGISYGEVVAEGHSETDVPQAVTITSLTPTLNASLDSDGKISNELNSIFSVKTNGDANSYDFIIMSSIIADEGEVPAYCEDGSILFAHTEVKPTSEAVEKARAHTPNNRNVIAYPTSVAGSSVRFEKKDAYGYCYVLDIGSEQEVEVTHTVSKDSVSGTYDIGLDQAGTYRAVVYLTAVSK